MSYLALYRKYRPQNFEDIIGQNHITQTLINQIKNGKVGHAYLFCGSRGTGKTTTARVFAKAINCLSPVNGSPCGKCEVCKTFEESNNVDIVEIDAASNNGVDDARDLREKVKFLPLVGKKKVFIIDEVHMLSSSAFNALLKTLEEPPEHVVFIFGTTEIQKLPSTILSRLMRFDFRLLSVEELEGIVSKILKDNSIEFEKEAANLIARAAEGSVRDALSLLDSCTSFSAEKLTAKNVIEVLGSVEREDVALVVDSILKNDIGNVLLSMNEVLSKGKSPLVFSKDIISFVRDLLVVKTLGEKANKIVSLTSEDFNQMKKKAEKSDVGILMEIVEMLSSAEPELRQSVHPRIILETAVIKVLSENSLEKRICEIEKKLSGSQTIKIDLPIETKTKVDLSKKNILGMLLQNLRDVGNPALLAVCQEIEEIEIQEGKALVVVPSETSFEFLTKQTNQEPLQKFFKDMDLKFSFLLKKNQVKKIDADHLKKIIGENVFTEEE